MPERVSPHAGMSDETLEHHMKRYIFAQPYVAGKTVLSIACGNGYGEHMFATEAKAARVIGMDVSEEAIDFAKEHYQAEHLEYRVCDALAIDLPDNAVDVVVSFETIEHIEDDIGYLKELRRVLKPGGIALISTPNKAKSLKNYFASKPLNPYHVREYVPHTFTQTLETTFEITGFYGQKTIFKRRWYMVPLYMLYKLSGRLRTIERRDYEVRPYPKGLLEETAIFVAVCT